MKYIVNGFLVFSFLLLLGLATAEEVLDTDGDMVVPFDNYYIMPFIFDVGGGLSLAAAINKTTCPVNVVREISEDKNGMPLKIISEARAGFVPTGTSLTISFVNKSECVRSSEWIMVRDDQNWFVGIGDVENHPSREIMRGWFMIEKYEKGYKLVFCPHSDDDDGCGDIGITIDENRNRRLSLVDEGAFVIVFRKAS